MKSHRLRRCMKMGCWLRGLVPLHRDVTIRTSTPKQDTLVNLSRTNYHENRTNCHKYAMQMLWKVCQFKEEDLNVLDMQEFSKLTLQWRNNECNVVSNYQRLDCLLNRLFMRKSKKTSNPRVTGIYEGTSPVTGKIPAQRANNAKNVSIWWRHHEWNAPIFPAKSQSPNLYFYPKLGFVYWSG